MASKDDNEAFIEFEQSKIKRLVTGLEEMQQKIKEGNYPAIQLHKKAGRSYWLNGDGIGVAIWYPENVANGDICRTYAPHIRIDLTPSDFIEKYLTKNSAEEIAKTIGISL